MAYGNNKDHDQDDDRKGRSSKTSDFNTAKLVGDDGTFFGVKLSADLASTANVFSQQFIPWIRRKLQVAGEPMARDFGKNMLNMSEKEAIAFGAKAHTGIGYATIFSLQLADLASNLYSTAKSMNELRAAVVPVMQANGADATAQIEAMFGNGNNEVIATARHKINGIFWQKNIKTATSAIAAIPQYKIMMDEEIASQAGRQQQREWDTLKNASDEEKAKWFSEKMGVSGAVEVSRGAMTNNIATQMEKAYREKFAVFEKERGKEIARELEKEIGSSALPKTGETTIDFYFEKKRKEYGISSYEASKLSDTKYNDRYKEIFKREKEKVIKEKIKSEFVKKNGAFDHTWNDGYTFGMSSLERRDFKTPKTLREEFVEHFNKVYNEQHGLTEKKALTKEEKEEASLAKDVQKQGYILAGSLAGELAGNVLGTKGMEKFKNPIALDRILHLRRFLEENHSGKELTTVPGIKLAKGGEPDASFAKNIHDIFEQHQRDTGRSEIGNRFFEKLEKAGWKDDAIQKLDDKDLNPYEYAIKHISRRIKDGEMDASALINLVGDKNNKIVRDSGKAFGPAGAEGNDEVAKQTIGRYIDQQTVLLHANKHMTEEQKSQAMGAFAFSEEELKYAFGPKGLLGEERAFLFTLIQAQVPDAKVICKMTGMEEKDCESLRKEVQERFGSLLDAAAVELVHLLDKNPDKMAAMKMTQKEKGILSDMVRKVETGKPLADADRKDLKAVETVMANAVMAISKTPEENQNFWQKVVERSRKPKQEAAKDDEAHHASPMSHRSRDKDVFDERPHAKKQARDDDNYHDRHDRVHERHADREPNERGHNERGGHLDRLGVSAERDRSHSERVSRLRDDDDFGPRRHT